MNRSLQKLSDGRIDFSPPKTAKGRRSIDLSPSCTLLLREYRERQALDRIMVGQPLTENDQVFSYGDGTLFSPDTVTHAFIKLVRKIGVKPIKLHDLRHTHASLMLKQGVHPKIVQERLGHASIQITLDTYSHVAPGLQKAAARSFDEMLNGKHENEVVENHY